MKKNSLYEGTTGERIKYLRCKYGISQGDLAVLVGITEDMIKKYEKGIIPSIPMTEIEIMADILHTTKSYLMGWEPANFVHPMEILRDAMADTKDLETEEIIIDPADPRGVNVFFEMYGKTPQEKDTIINTGFFEYHIEGYLTLTLRAAGYPESEVNHLRSLYRNHIKHEVTGQQARKAGEIIGIVANKAAEKAMDAKIISFPFHKK